MLKNTVKANGLSDPGVPIADSATGGSSVRSGTGKITHDSRGNAIWEWGVATGIFARIKTTELLSLHENPTLALEGECQRTAGEWS